MGLTKKQTFICLDCESTGLDPKNDRLIEVAAVRFTLEQTFDDCPSYETLVNPEIEIPQESIEIHHIDQKMVADKPLAQEILPELFEFVGKHPIVGHAIHFDIDLLASTAERVGVKTSIRKNTQVDTVRLGRLYGESPSNSLEKLREHFNIPLEGAHRAMSDVKVNIEVFKQLVKPYHTMQKLLNILSRPIALKTMPLGKHKGRLFKDIPLEYLRWAAHKDFDQDLLFSLRSELKRRKTKRTFSEQASPFKDL